MLFRQPGRECSIPVVDLRVEVRRRVQDGMRVLLPNRLERVRVGPGGDLGVRVRLVRMGVDNGRAGIEAFADLDDLLLNGLRGERVHGLGRRSVDGAFEDDRRVRDRFLTCRRCGSCHCPSDRHRAGAGQSCPDESSSVHCWFSVHLPGKEIHHHVGLEPHARLVRLEVRLRLTDLYGAI